MDSKPYLKSYPVEFLGYKMNYEQLQDAAFRFANALLRLGIRKGDRVAIMLPNCPQGVIPYFGTLMIGGIVAYSY